MPETQVEYPDMATVQIIGVVTDPQLIGRLRDMKPCNFAGQPFFEPCPNKYAMQHNGLTHFAAFWGNDMPSTDHYIYPWPE